MSDIVARREMTFHDDKRIKTYSLAPDGSVVFVIHGGGGLDVDVFLSREEALQLSKNLEDVVAAYDATVDRFHEVCDEPAVSA